MERRDLLKASALAAAFSSTSIQRALALPATHRYGSLKDVEHIVVLMQENRSFDHYFGTLRGVRGHNDRFCLKQADGRYIWQQTREDPKTGTILPFHLDTSRTGAQAVQWLDHSWVKTHAAINAGLMNKWPAYKTNMTMGHYTREDIPFHFELADAFTICDQYFCSVPGPTHPNRMFLMTGTNDPSGKNGGPLIDNVDIVDNPSLPAFSWTTYPERLQEAGISWQVYQQGMDWKDPYNGNYGLNVLQNFKQYINAPEGSPLKERGYSVRTLKQFSEDVHDGKLPQVSWLIPPAAFSEHPKYMPAYGATYISEILDTLTANPEVWSKTVLFVMYDENDGYFDHIIPPQPPTPVQPGLSTVSTKGEIHDVVNPYHHPHYQADQRAYGLGPRVPMFVISPWSKGGYVNSQVFDHTSVIRFIEARFGVYEPNISDWRRAVCGDLTSAFDFSKPNHQPANLMKTYGFREKADHEVATLPKAIAPQNISTMMPQEPGTCRSRPLPYEVSANFSEKNDHILLSLVNTGRQGAVFHVYMDGDIQHSWTYTVGAHTGLQANLPLSQTGFTLYGTNGFYRYFKPGADGIDIYAVADRGNLKIYIETADTPKNIDFIDLAYGTQKRSLFVKANAAQEEVFDLSKSYHWYDLQITTENAVWRFAGHIETGSESMTDPAATLPLTASVS